MSTRDQESRGPLFTKISIILLAISLTITIVRFFLEHRRRVTKNYQDLLMLFTAISLIVQTVIGNLAVQNGFGHHISAIQATGGDREKALLYFWAFQLVYKCSVCLAKSSILALYLRIFTTNGKTRLIIKASFAVVMAGAISFFITTLFQCIPISKAWNKKAPGHCVNNTAFRWSWAAFDIITDLWIWLLPIRSFIKLNQSLPQKLGLVGVFLLGLFTCLAGVLRMTGIEKSTTTKDVSWGSIPAFIWSDVEAKTALICVCLPAFKSLLCGCVDRKDSSARSRSYGDGRDLYQLSTSIGTKTGQQVIVAGCAGSSDQGSETGILADSRGIQVTQEWKVDEGEPERIKENEHVVDRNVF